MHLIYLLARIYPYWALPLVIILGQVAFFFRRRRSKAQFTALGAAAFLAAGIVAWFAFRGDLHSDHWVRKFLGD